MGRLNKFLFLAGVAFYILDPPTGLAYNDQTTHPALTDEIVDFYNLVFSNNPLTSEEKEWIITGSINEDVIPRMMNHFYDPVTSQGWTGELAGSVSVDALRKIAEMGSGFTPFPATQWATDYLTQQGYSLYGGNHSWKRGLDEYAEGKRMEAFITLGHALHLLEDMGVPDHTRNDTHVDAVEGITGDEGSPYEQYASRWNRTTIEALGLPGKINAATESVPNKSKVEDYLVSLAQYSSKYFFSKDTINDLKYASPRIVRMDENFGYGIDEADKEFLLVKHITYKNGLRYTEEYVLDKNSDPIFDAYFARLSRQILLHGVGVVNLFLKQAEDVKVNLEYQKASNPLYFAVVKPTGDVVSAAKFSPAGFFSNMYSSFSFALNSLANGFSRSLGFVNSLLGQGENPRLAKETVGTPEQINIENEFIQKSIDRVNRGFDMATITPQVESSASSAINTKLSESGLTEKEQVLTPNSPVEQLENESNAGPQEGDIPTPIFPPGGGGGSGPAGEMAIGDNSPPEAVVSLVASGAASSSLTLNWTAPADAGVAIASYEIVYATTTITEDNWANGRAVPPPTPLAPGTSQEILISGLSPNTTYYFAIRSRDSVGNESAISNVVSTTTLSASKVSNVNHVLISEMQVSGSAGAGDEFIELYNPTDGEENISNWSIQYLSGEATSTAQVYRKNFEASSIIPSRGYFLIVRNTDAGGGDGYVGSNTPDMVHRSFSLSAAPAGATVFLVNTQEDISGSDDATIVDKVAYGSGSGLLPESSAAVLPGSGQSLERLAWDGSTCIVASGENEFLGNGCDRQNNLTDFELLTTAKPQNSSSLPETRSAPTINGFSGAYSSSTLSADFSWLPSTDAAGATSTNSYTISLVNATGSPTILWQGTSTVFSTEIFEETVYVFEAQDRDSMTASATTTITSPFFSYLGVIFEQTASSTLHEIGGQYGNHYWAQVFRPQRTGRVNAITIKLTGTTDRLDGVADCTLRIYKTDSPQTTSTSNLVGSAYEETQGEVMHGARCVVGNALNVGKFDFSTSTIEAGEVYTLVYSYKDPTHWPLLRGGGDTINGEYRVDGTPYSQKDAAFGLEGIVMSLPMNPEPPSAPTNLQTLFNPNSLLLNVSWAASIDPDSPASEVIYQINITTSTELSSGGWTTVGSGTLATTTVSFSNSYLIGVRAADEFRDLSSVATSSWSFPAGFSVSETIIEQLDTNSGDIGANGQDGHKTNQYGQTFSVASSSIPYSIVLNTAGTQSGYCDVKIYSADSIDNANPSNLVAESETILGSACNAASGKIFQFRTTGELIPGTTYIWIYSARDGVGLSDGIIGGYKETGYPGTFYKKRDDGAVGTTGVLPSTYSAYFRLLGNVD